MRCVVPNCENTIGISFPEDYELQNIWLKSLGIPDGVPDVDSFVCLDHFDKEDVEEFINEEGSIHKKVRPGAIPKLFTLTDDIEKETEEFLEFRSQKIVDSQETLPLPENSESIDPGKLSQPFEEASEEIPINQNVLLNTDDPNFVPQFQEFREDVFILEQQEFSESQSPSQQFSGFNQEPEVVPNQEPNIKSEEESNLVVQENQDFLTIQHEFTPQQNFTSEEQDFTAQNQTTPIYNSEEPQMFSSEGHEEFVPESKPNLTSENPEVFLSEEQPTLSAIENKFDSTEGHCMETENSQNVDQENGEVQDGDLIEHQDVSLNQEQGHNEQEGDILHESAASEQEMATGQTVPDGSIDKEFEDPGSDHQHQLNITGFEQKPIEINHKIDPNHTEICQGLSTQMLIEGEQAPFLHPSTPSENIVMQWFVPDQPPIDSESVTQTENPNIAPEEDNIGSAAHQQELKSSQLTFTQRLTMNQSQEIHVPTPIRTPRNMSEILKKEDLCRLCMSKDQVNVNILDNIKDKIMVLEAIQLCIPTLEISVEDPFSKSICFKCFNLLQKYFEFRHNCIKIDSEQKRAYEKAHPLHRFVEKRKVMPQYGNYPKKTHMKTIISPSKVGYQQTEIVTVVNSPVKRTGQKNISRKVILTPKPQNQSQEIQYLLQNFNKETSPNENCIKKMISKVNKPDDIQVFKLRKNAPSTQSSSSYGTKYTTGQKRPAVPISVSQKKFKPSEIEALVRKPPLSTEKQIKIQEELKRVIEGTMSKDDLSVDHVIVRVVSDDETDDMLENFSSKRKRSGVQIMESKYELNKMKIGRSEVVIPKGIRVSIPEKFESSKGIFPCFPKFGAFETEFCLIDGYLFEHRLCKGKVRYLRCVSLSCPSKAWQKCLGNGKFENRACVKCPHNHQQLSGTEIKKQMFYYVMKKKMQADKGLNFRSLYDQICSRDPEIKTLVPLRNLINEICRHQLTQKIPQIKSFDDFYNAIEDDCLEKFQFTYLGKQFYQERFTVKEDGTKAVVFANRDSIAKVSHSKLMYVDASFKIDTGENFSYQLVTVLVWIDDSYYPIMFALVSDRTMEIFKKIFAYLHDTLAPDLCPEEIVTDYESNIYYALGETYLESHIGGSVFYYTQNLYKKICELGLSRELETTSYFRNIYHMLLMLPLLPVNTIMDGLQNIEIQANDLGVGDSTAGLFEHIKEQWMDKVTPDLFCVHRLENRINENVIAPFKKLRDFLMLNKGKAQRQTLCIMNVVEKLIDLDNFLQTTYSSENKKSFGRDLSSSQKKNVLKAWQYIETHPKININHFFTKVIGYIKCMENQLWIWGYYKFSGKVTDDLINAANFSIVNTNEDGMEVTEGEEDNSNFVYTEDSDNTVVVEAVVGPSGEFVISDPENNQEGDSSIFKYVNNK